MLLSLLIHVASANMAPPFDLGRPCEVEAYCGSADAGQSCQSADPALEPCPELAESGLVLACVRNVPSPDGTVTAVYCTPRESLIPILSPAEPPSSRRCGAAGQALLLPVFVLGWRRRRDL